MLESVAVLQLATPSSVPQIIYVGHGWLTSRMTVCADEWTDEWTGERTSAHFFDICAHFRSLVHALVYSFVHSSVHSTACPFGRPLLTHTLHAHPIPEPFNIMVCISVDASLEMARDSAQHLVSLFEDAGPQNQNTCEAQLPVREVDEQATSNNGAPFGAPTGTFWKVRLASLRPRRQTHLPMGSSGLKPGRPGIKSLSFFTNVV